MANAVVPSPNVELIQAANVPHILDKIRAQWQAKDLIRRVRRLLEVDPSSACQRLFNAAIHDLREKVVVAGLDIAAEAAKQHRLPPVDKADDIENYAPAKLIDLAYRMGLLSRPEWRRVVRCYEIRRDLEHEDDEYEAGVEDCVYIFNTCVEVILASDPIQLLKVTDVKEIVEQPSPAVPDDIIVEDYERAPQPRQAEILKFVVSAALDKSKADIVQQNAFSCLSYLQPVTKQPVLLSIGEEIQKRVGRGDLDTRTVRVANAIGVLPYLRQTARKKFFDSVFAEMRAIGTHWKSHPHHGGILHSFMEYGAFQSCPVGPRKQILKWMMLTYLGEPGGQTTWGNVRHVFYSNSASPLIRQIFKENRDTIRADVRDLAKDKDVKQVVSSSQFIARRLEELLDAVEAS